MTLDDLNKLNREAEELTYQASHMKSAIVLVGVVGRSDAGLFHQIREKSKLNNDGWTPEQRHKLALEEVQKVIDEHAEELLGIAERRLAAKHADLTQRAAMKRALLRASITPVEVSSD